MLNKIIKWILGIMGVVIAKTSAYVDYNNTGDEMEFESMEAFRAIAKGL